MVGVNAGYDSRPMATGQPDTGVAVTGSRTVFFQQVAAGFEAVSNTWNANVYALAPFGTTNAQLNSVYQGGTLQTYGLDVGYNVAPDLEASICHYYQNGDLNTADGSGVRGHLAYNLSNRHTIGANLSYDQAFNSRLSADLKYRFGFNGCGAPSNKKARETPATQALTTSAKNRDVRANDACATGVG